jgi:hypothetical protein
MITPAHENRLNSFDDVLASDYDIMIDGMFHLKIKDMNYYAAVKPRLTIVKRLSGDQYKQEFLRQHFVFIRTCENVDYDMNLVLDNGQSVTSLYYRLPEKMFQHYVQLEASFRNPFLERLQYFMDLCFQAGLHHIWDVYSSKINVKSHEIEEEKQLLELEDFSQIFIIFAVGLMLATLVLLVEIFLHDCLVHFRFRDVVGRIRSCMRKAIKRKTTRKVKVRKIIVKPRVNP